LKTLIVKSYIDLDKYFIFRQNNIEIEIRVENNIVESDIDLTETEKKDIAKLLQYENIKYVTIERTEPINKLKQWHKINNNYK